mmetsp:Transcript_822/g.1478  ORF Transcript_822/g.1478 Transcript_822/m.1478 type:complete len:129 (-) Transcript_822:312-698(-)
MPELTSNDLPQITKSVLKTRSTLGLNKVYKYLFRRLISLKVDELLDRETGFGSVVKQNMDDVNPEEKIEIYCKDNLLKPTLQLKNVKDLYWHEPFAHNQNADLLILNYRWKKSNQENLAISLDQDYET